MVRGGLVKQVKYWLDNDGGGFMNSEQSMKDLVTNGIIKWYKEIGKEEFKRRLVG